MNVLLVEDDAGMREAVAEALRRGGHAVTARGDGESAVTALGEGGSFGAAVVDMRLPGISGPETLRLLRARSPDLPMLVLTVFEDPDLILEAVRAGATGYLLKGAGAEEICRAVEQVALGLSPLSQRVARHVLDLLRPRPSVDERLGLLTERERQVLELLARGNTYGRIAEALNLGVGTVQSYVKNVYRKLQVTSKTEAARLVFKDPGARV